MLINQIINIEEDFGSGAVAEPVTLQQAKDYMRLSGFGDTSGEQDFDFDDDLIEAMIEEGRQWVEKFTGQYVVPRSLEVRFLNQAGGLRLPGPATGVPVYTNHNGDVITLTTVGTTYPQVKQDWYGGYIENVRVVGVSLQDDHIIADYGVGYAVYPAWVQNAIKAYVLWAYQRRGDEQDGSPARAAAICRPHKKTSAWG